MKVRQGQDGLFFVESESKRDTQEHAVNVDLVCTCHDYTTRCAPRRRVTKELTLWPSTERTACKHAHAVLLFLGLQVQGQLKKQQR